MTEDMPPVVTMQWIADDLGVPLSTVWTYRKRAERNRRNGNPRPGDLPPADAAQGRTPMWTAETYRQWKANRPGRGAGGGPKPKTAGSAEG